MSKPTQLTKPVFIKAKQLKPGQHGYNVYLRVEDVQRDKATRADGSTLEIAEALCGDETASVRVRAIGDNASKLIKGKLIAIRNGRSEVFKERMRLEIDRWGRITDEPNAKIETVNVKDNLSDIEYETKFVKVSGRGGAGGNRGGNRGGRGGRRGNARRGRGY
mmetsp:Transcript_12778/g.10921  ORF Transcript_12778/g.10921 Transcript_12778/m.10921 type:complete len:163 (-) Transcript_12778:376-864(-)